MALAIQFQGSYVLLLDDKDARDEASRQGLHLTGTFGLLRGAREQGFIEAAYPLLQRLRELGFWISPSLIARIEAEERGRPSR